MEIIKQTQMNKIQNETLHIKPTKEFNNKWSLS